MFIDQLLTLHETFTKKIPSSQKGRVVVGSMGSFRARPFCVSDFFSFGFTEDIISMWDLELDAHNENTREVLIKERSGSEIIPIKEEDMDHLNYVTCKTRCEKDIFQAICLKSGFSTVMIGKIARISLLDVILLRIRAAWD